MNIEPIITPPTALPKGEPFASLAPLRRRHSVLLRANQSENEADRPRLEELVQFIAQIKATGRNLASESRRETAQGFLDYWEGVVLARRPDAFPRLGLLDLDPYEGRTPADAEPADQCEHETAARAGVKLREAAEAVEKGLDAKGRAALRLVLKRLFSLSAGSQEVCMAPLAACDPVLETPLASEIVTRLKEAGTLLTEGEATSLSYVLAHPSLLTDWPLLKKLCNQRKSLREMASGWDRAGRTEAALLNGGPQLDLAMEFADLNPVEQAFVEQSRRHAAKTFQVMAGAALVLLIIGATVFFFQYYKVQSANKALLAERDKVVLANKELEEANANLWVALSAATGALHQADKLSDGLHRARTLLADAGAVEPTNAALHSLILKAQGVFSPLTDSNVNYSIRELKRALTNQFGAKYRLML